MYTALALSALVALSSALPVADQLDEMKNISWNDPCAPQPLGYGPVSLSDTVEDFYASPDISVGAEFSFYGETMRANTKARRSSPVPPLH